MASTLKSSFVLHLIAILVIIIALQKTYNCKRELLQSNNKNFIILTSIRCQTFDQYYIVINKCFLKAINRTQKYFRASGVVMKTWNKPIMIHFRVLKRANGGFKPFGIDVNFEGCKYLAGKKNPAVDWFYNMNFRHSNVNHTCPYVEKDNVTFNVPVNQMQYPSVFPGGDYRFEIEFGTAGKMRAAVYAVLSLKEL